MTRTPAIDVPSLKVRDDLPTVSAQYTYQLITPLYGGGAQQREADPVSVVRATEVRGQLRFWWRATRGGQFGGDLAAMKAAEDVLWGAASTPDTPRPSLVQVEVQPDRQTVPTSVREMPNHRGVLVPLGDPASPWSYVAFPLREHRQAALLVNVVFTLHLVYPRTWPSVSPKTPDVTFGTLFPSGATPEQEVQAALWAWETFGGIGARTRRGFGALVCTARPGGVTLGTVQQTLATIRRRLATHVTAGSWPSGVPHLRQDSRVAALREASPSGEEAWEQLFGKLRDFRQARVQRMGYSTWPEPEAIRHLVLGRPARLVKFPRAHFGLPIIFQFKGRSGVTERPNTLIARDEGKKYDRMASPLIVRPVRCSNNQYLGLGIVLEGPRFPPGQLVLEGEGGPWSVPSTALSASEAGTIRAGQRPVVRATPNDDGTIDILAAFLNYLEA